MAKEITSFFKDHIVPKADFQVRDTLGTTPGQPQDGSQAGVSGKVTPKELPSNVGDLWHGPNV